MNKQEAGRLGGKAVVKKYGVEYMARIGSRGFWATLQALAERQALEPHTPGVNPYRHLLENLKARKAGERGRRWSS